MQAIKIYNSSCIKKRRDKGGCINKYLLKLRIKLTKESCIRLTQENSIEFLI